MSRKNKVINASDIAYWARKIHLYSAIPLTFAMVFFSITGFLLNHPEWEFGQTKTQQYEVTPPEFLLNETNWSQQYHQQALNLLLWLDKEHGLSGPESEIEWDEGVLILTIQGPGKHLLVELDTETQSFTLEAREHSFMALLNNVHRAKHVSGHWRLLSDVSALLMLVFSVSGLILLMANRVQAKTHMPLFVLGTSWFGLAMWLMH